MNLIRRTIEIDEATDARPTEIAAQRGQDVATVLADAVALLDSLADFAGLDIAEDRRRLNQFLATGEAVSFDDIKAGGELEYAATTPRPFVAQDQMIAVSGRCARRRRVTAITRIWHGREARP